MGLNLLYYSTCWIYYYVLPRLRAVSLLLENLCANTIRECIPRVSSCAGASTSLHSLTDSSKRETARSLHSSYHNTDPLTFSNSKYLDEYYLEKFALVLR